MSPSIDAPVDCSITCYGGLRDFSVPVEALGAWGKHTSVDFRLCMFPGGHFFVRENWIAVTEDINKVLNKVLVVLMK